MKGLGKTVNNVMHEVGFDTAGAVVGAMLGPVGAVVGAVAGNVIEDRVNGGGQQNQQQSGGGGTSTHDVVRQAAQTCLQTKEQLIAQMHQVPTYEGRTVLQMAINALNLSVVELETASGSL